MKIRFYTLILLLLWSSCCELCELNEQEFINIAAGKYSTVNHRGDKVTLILNKDLTYAYTLESKNKKHICNGKWTPYKYGNTSYEIDVMNLVPGYDLSPFGIDNDYDTMSYTFVLVKGNRCISTSFEDEDNTNYNLCKD